MELERYEQAALDSIVQAMRSSNIPVRRPSWNDPTFWSRPLTKTVIIPLSTDTAFSTVLEVRGLNGYTGVVTGYVATSYTPMDLSSVDFRLAYKGALIPTVELASGVERNRESGTQFPTFPQQTFFILDNDQSTLWIQARNNNVLQQTLLLSVYGWYFDNQNQAERGTLEGMTDA